MKKIFLLLMMTAVVLTGCKKNETPQADQATGEVEFNITNIMDEGSRVEIPNIPDCDLEAVADYAVVAITDGTDPIPGSPFTMAISDIGDLMTDVLKLAPGTYYVTSFEVFTSDDVKIWAAPLEGSFYADFMNIPLNVEFTVVAYQKAGVEVEVLCYDETVADEFGFTWFDIDKVVLKDVCLFGDICLTQFPGVDNWTDYGYSGEFDMPALFQVELYKNGTLLATYSNFEVVNDVIVPNDPLEALCIQYPDALEVDGEEFDLVLSVLQPDGNGGFALHEWYTFEWTDDAQQDGNLNFGDDNVIDFYIGDCFNDATPPDYAWPESCPPCFTQGYEINTDGWYDQNNGWYGIVTQTASGTDGITSSEGSWHAIFEEDTDSAPYTSFCGNLDTWTGNWFAQTDVYLDINWTDGEGFDYSVAASRQDGTHLRDFIWHVGYVDGYGLLVNASNNTDAIFNSYKLLNENGGNYYTITSSGWYTLKTVFTDVGDVLTVNLELYDASGTLLLTNTRSNPADLISTVVGGSRYGWFTFISVDGGIALDETILDRPCE
ncbi:MAG: hypothetical protein KQH67_08840 [Bacteroidetes bacterium]|nr:hypothetical protein [Bacteroidota bacterium]